MSEKNFYDHLREKLNALRAKTRNQSQDWESLNRRLDQVLPEREHHHQRSGLLLPLLLLFALLLSNFLWWRGHHENQVAIRQLEMNMASLQHGSATFTRTDTVWRTKYIRVPDFDGFLLPKSQPGYRTKPSNYHTTPEAIEENKPKNPATAQNRSTPINQVKIQTTTISDAGKTDESNLVIDPANLSIPDGTASPGLLATAYPELLEIPERPGLSTLSLPISLDPKPLKPVRPIGRVILNAIKPTAVKIGGSAGLFYPLSASLTHQIGYKFGATGAINFARHWSVTVDYSYGDLHYEAAIPAAVLGAPDFPKLPSADYHYAHIDIQKQAFWKFGLGLQYTFLKAGQPRPFVGLNWGNQTLLPYEIAYEVQYEPGNTIQPGLLKIGHRSSVRNLLGLRAGLDVPLSRRLDFVIEAYYLRQWKKHANEIPDLPGIQLGFNWAL